MEVDLRMFLEPAVAPLMGVEIVEDDMQLASRKGSHDVLHEAEKLGTTPPLRMCRNDPSGGDFERCKQCRSAVPFVVVALAAQGASIRQPQISLRPLQRLDRRLFVDTEDNRLGWRVNVEADHIGCFGHKLRIVALAPGLARNQIDLVLPQEPPNILNINVFQRLRQQRTRPSGIARGRLLVQKRQNALVCRRAVDRRLGSAGAIVQPSKSVIGKAGACPWEWCNSRWETAITGMGRMGQPAVVGRLRVGSSLKGAIVSSVM